VTAIEVCSPLETFWQRNINSRNEKALRETQTLCTGCSKAKPKIPPEIIALLQTPFPGPKFNQLDGDGHHLYLQIGREDRCTQFRVIVVTDPPYTNIYTHKKQQTGPITIHCAAASAQCNDDCFGLLVVCK